MFIEITAMGQTVMRRDMLRFGENLAMPMFALQEAAMLLRAVEERQFDSEGQNSGGWAPLADSTVAEKARKGLSPQILQATGRLKDSLTQKFNPEHVERLSPDSLAFGSDVPYGTFHQTGTHKMPKRPPLALSEADKVALVKVMQQALVTGVRASGSSLRSSLTPGQLLGAGL